jgi:hypothetical protein
MKDASRFGGERYFLGRCLGGIVPSCPGHRTWPSAQNEQAVQNIVACCSMDVSNFGILMFKTDIMICYNAFFCK